MNFYVILAISYFILALCAYPRCETMQFYAILALFGYFGRSSAIKKHAFLLCEMHMRRVWPCKQSASTKHIFQNPCGMDPRA